MKVLVIGGGGREHALVWAIAQSPRVTEVVCAPGNGGIAELARCVPVDQKNLFAMVQLAITEKPDLTVIGPEGPLSLGLADELMKHGLRVFGPTKRAAMLETSKAFAKDFMQRNRLPTAAYQVCGSNSAVQQALEKFQTPVVVKADGLAAGKGVVICQTRDEAREVARQMMDGTLLGTGCGKVVLEEFLEGEEISWFIVADGRGILPLAAAQDHKRIGEGDTGPNTGGMGAYSTDDLLPSLGYGPLQLTKLVAGPVIEGMAAQEDAPFIGTLFCGLMATKNGCSILEYNTRFGDPETQAILPRLAHPGELLDVMEAAVEERLNEVQLEWRKEASVTVVAASQGYPGKFEVGREITGLDEADQIEGVTIFHSGTALSNGKLFTAGGRVLAVTAVANTLQQACHRAYAALSKIRFEGMVYRRDIGHRALKRVKQTRQETI